MSNTAIWCRRFGVPEEILQIENTDTEALKENYIRVKMNLSPINASDLIPVTGAYGHRITPPFIVGYEGVGEVLVATGKWSHLKGRRVLPLRGPGTWQSIVDCNAELAIPVPTNISDELAARAYINPLAALMMLRFFPVKGKRVLLTAAGSDCALYLGQWAIRFGAKSVAGIHRSPIHHKKISSCGILPISQDDLSAIQHYSSMSDVVYDATGGDLAELILNHLPKVSKFIGYGSLSGEPYKQALYHPSVTWFHLRNYLDRIPVQQWQSLFLEIWPLIRCSLSNATYTYPISSWKDALKLYKTPGRIIKPMLKIS